MKTIIDHDTVITALRQRFDPVPPELEFRIRDLTVSDDIESLCGDLRHCRSIVDVEHSVAWREGRQSGRVEGMRDAVFTLLGIQDDPLCDEIGDKAFETDDLEKLEELVLWAGMTRMLFALTVGLKSD